jgi:signal peptide peptidase-like protein 2B
MSLLKLNSIKVATLLMVAVFVYDIFFVFITPYLTGGDSVMLTVAGGGGGDESFCYKYPDDNSCKGVGFIPMLFILPKVNDPDNGSVILGLGDIVCKSLRREMFVLIS